MIGILRAVTSPKKFFAAMAIGMAEEFRKRYKLRTTINATDAGMVVEHELVLKPLPLKDAVEPNPLEELEARLRK